MNLYTGTGDTGETSLIDGSRVAKDDLRVAAYGTVDELNCVLGWCRAGCTGVMSERILEIQQELFELGCELATPPGTRLERGGRGIDTNRRQRLEAWIDESQAATGRLNHFVVPGGTDLACRLHVARTVCRRTERCVVALHRTAPVRAELLVYLNRLGDLLYAWALLANAQAGCHEIAWPASSDPTGRGPDG